MNIDPIVLHFFVTHRLEWLTILMVAISYFGNSVIVSLLTLFFSISFYVKKQAARLFPLLLSVIGSFATTFILKRIVDRSRPPLQTMIGIDTDPSFPSGHATAAMALYGFLIYLTWRYNERESKKFYIIFFAALIILIGISRLYLGAHFLTDVLAGYGVGLIWIWISAKFEKKLEKLLHWRPNLRSVR